jgi:polygalacturonase
MLETIARRGTFFFILVGLFAQVAHAQDARTVSEPLVPPECSVLAAEFQTPDPLPAHDDTQRIQRAIDQCPAGRAVRLATTAQQNAFISGPLTLRSGVSLIVDAGTTLYATSDPRAYDKGLHTCGTNDKSGKGCKPFITVDDARGSGIMGQGVIDGQGGHPMSGTSESWWQLSRRAQKEQLAQNVPHLIVISRSQDFVLYRITLRNSLKFHVVLNQVDGFTAWGVKIDTPADARNTDGIDPISSRNVTVTNSFIRAGDDNVAIKSGSAGPTENVSILHNHFYSGHGMSIGSNTDGGISHVLVNDLSMDGTTSGLRIKSDVSRGGLVTDIHYRNVCLRDVRAPIDVDTTYDPQAKGDKIPVYSGLFFEHIHSLTSGRMILKGLDAKHPLSASFDDVIIDGSPAIEAMNARFTLGPGPVRPVPSGSDVQIDGKASDGTGVTCDLRFLPFPVTTTLTAGN